VGFQGVYGKGGLTVLCADSDKGRIGMGEAKRREEVRRKQAESKFTIEKRFVRDEDYENKDLFWVRGAVMIGVFYLVILGVVWYLQ
jgi:hypothetical protein